MATREIINNLMQDAYVFCAAVCDSSRSELCKLIFPQSCKSCTQTRSTYASGGISHAEQALVKRSNKVCVHKRLIADANCNCTACAPAAPARSSAKGQWWCLFFLRLMQLGQLSRPYIWSERATPPPFIHSSLRIGEVLPLCWGGCHVPLAWFNDITERVLNKTHCEQQPSLSL